VVAAVSAEAPRVVAESRSPAPVAEVTATPPLFNAAYLRNPAPVYPAIARRSGEHGTVMLKVLVSPEGAPQRIELDQSSGSKSLDGAALEAVKGWRFVPARRGAQNIEGWVRVPVVFKLES
jgi:protein TonB